MNFEFRISSPPTAKRTFPENGNLRRGRLQECAGAGSSSHAPQRTEAEQVRHGAMCRTSATCRRASSCTSAQGTSDMPVIHVLKTHWQCKFRPALTAAAVSDGWCWRALTAAAPLRPARVSQLSYCPALSFAWSLAAWPRPVKKNTSSRRTFFDSETCAAAGFKGVRRRRLVVTGTAAHRGRAGAPPPPQLVRAARS